MRPNLTFAGIAGALAVLGTSAALAACGGDEKKPPVGATEVKTTNDNVARPADGHCGAGKEHAAGQASCGAKDPAAPATGAAAATPATASATATAPPPNVPATPGTPASAAPTTSASAKPPAPPPKAPPKSGAQSSCGAGTCSAKK